MDAEHSLLSTISMIAPSPDWFSGVYNFDVVVGEMWYESFTLSTFPWDAGSDSGDTYTSADQATTPQENIFQLAVDTLPDTMVFLSPTGGSVEPVATWTCSVQATEVVPGVTSSAPSAASSGIMPVASPPSVEPSAAPSSRTPTFATLPGVEFPSASPSVGGGGDMLVDASLAPSNAAGIDSSVPTTTPGSSSAVPPAFRITTVPGSTPSTTNVEVTCSFENQWTASRHPNDYPEGALWSPMVMASHSDSYQMWGSPEVLASDGVKLVAEVCRCVCFV